MESVKGGLSSIKDVAGAFVTGQSNSVVYVIIGIIIAIILLGLGINEIVRLQSLLATTGNVKRIGDEQISLIKEQYRLRNLNIKINNMWKDFKPTEKLLINLSMVGSRLLGYLGPFENGVFDEENSVKLALRTGARLFILDIDYDKSTCNPVLVYRNNENYVKSLNKGSIKKTVDALVGNAFSSDSNIVTSGLNETPVILVLYFHNTPDMITETAKYIKFLGKVSKDIQSINSNLLGQTTEGDFHRQALDTQIWFQPWTLLKNKIILLTNVDTTVMRTADKSGVTVTPLMDLDYHVNSRIFFDAGVSGTITVSTGSKKQAAVIKTPSYFLTTPPDRIQDVINSTKEQLTICMDPNPTTNYSKADLDRLITGFGVHCVPIVNFKTMKELDPFFGVENIYENKSFVGKSAELRFVPPETITTQIPSKATDTRGGFVALKNY